jgi:hypothetical protein
MLKGPVIGAFRSGREKTGGKLPAVPMIAEAIAANTLPGARLIGAIAVGLILRLFAVHADSLY